MLLIDVACVVLFGLSAAPAIDVWPTTAATSTFAYDGEQYGYDEPTVLVAGLGSFDSGHRRGYDDRVNLTQARTDAFSPVLAAKAASGAESSLQGALLREHLRLTEKYGTAAVRRLEDGRIRYYGDIRPARRPGEMVGQRTVREWNPATAAQRTWLETVDQQGRVRIVRPETGGPKTHYYFDKTGGYSGSG